MLLQPNWELVMSPKTPSIDGTSHSDYSQLVYYSLILLFIHQIISASPSHSDCMPSLLVSIRLYLTSFLYFPSVPCTMYNKAISAYLSKPMFTLEEQWWETLERHRPLGWLDPPMLAC